MKVLWITNILFPEIASKLTGNHSLKSSGGWLLGAAEALLKYNSDVKLFVATVSNKVKTVTKIKGQNITYFVLPLGKGNITYNQEYEHDWKIINYQIQPDIVHIHGTEFTHGLSYVRACGDTNVLVSIQGLKSIYTRYFFSGLSFSDIIRSTSLSDILHRHVIYNDYKKFCISAKYERTLLQEVKHVIGRTSWDKANVWAINPQARYHFCNETLRDAFYRESLWSYNKCRAHSIFLSQAGYSIKGLHQLLKALPFVINQFPDTQVRIAGADISLRNDKYGAFHIRTYGNIIKKLLNKYNLNERVEFTGLLDDEGMKKEYLKCNLFVCPSSIENSPNSLGEAQILGVPCIASYVGGIPDLMSSNSENLYRFEEIEMLAYKICQVFANKEKQENMQNDALIRHDRETNAKKLYSIYETIKSNSNEI